MGQIEDLRSFVQIVELGSIGKAAEQAGIAKSAMSRKLSECKRRLLPAPLVNGHSPKQGDNIMIAV